MQPVPGPILGAIESIQLPSMPQVLLRFLRLSEDDRATTADLAKVAGQDPALCAQLLTTTYTTGSWHERGFESLERCLEALGRQRIRILAASLTIRSAFTRAVDDQNYDLTGFWRHSLQVAAIARAIAVRLDRDDGEEAYLAGLLHDLGQLLLLGGLSGRYATLLAWSRDEAALLALERPELNTDHAAVGAALIDQWQLPSFMADAVLFHHRRPDEIHSADPLSQIVWAAHAASAWTVAADDGGKPFEAAAIETMLGLPADSLAPLQGQAVAEVEQLASALGANATAPMTTLPRSSQAPFEGMRPHEHRAAWDEIEVAVCDMAMMAPLQRDLFSIDSEATLLQAIQESARLLFGLGRPAFLLLREDKPALFGADSDGRPSLLQRLNIPLEPGKSLAATAALGEQPRSVFDLDAATSASLVDVQIGRALGCDGVLYLPMRGNVRTLGVMAYGLSETQFRQPLRHLDWMQRLANLAAMSLEKWRTIRAREQQIVADLTTRFEQQARQVAHEAGNPLSIITNYLKIVSDRLPDESGVRHELDILKEEIDRVGLIIQRLSGMSVKAPTSDRVEVNAVIEGMAALYRESLFTSHGIALDLILDETLGAVPGSRDQIKQIVLNLWKNAAEAMSAGGRLVVSTTASVRQGGRDYAEIRLADTGPGLPPAVVRNLFQPLDAYRRPGHAGMGLSIVATLVKGLDGQITAQSRPGQGTTFIILLPQSERSEK